MRLPLYIDALRAMRTRQIAWRAVRIIPPALLALGTKADHPPSPRLIAAGLGCTPAPASGPSKPPHESGRFDGYGVTREFGVEPFWDDTRDGLLFLFHLHGFAPLASYAAGERTPEGDLFWALVVKDWLERSGGPRRPAWHAYPTSLRIIAWSAALSAIEGWPASLRAKVGGEILRQARYLRRAVEHDIGGNHVIKNATALAFAGTLFPSSGLRRAALRLLERETAQQVLSDGGHEERSTSYQLEVMKDLTDVGELLTRTGGERPPWLSEAVSRMVRWRRALAGPDDRAPLLNDAWEGPLIDGREKGPLTVLRDSGYVVLRDGMDQLIFDAGPLCPPHLPPHAHADALSVVLWLGGRALLVDPGSGAYTGAVREQMRGTAAHNTVEVGGVSQCVFFGDFRACRLPRVAEPWIEHHGDFVVAFSAHDGYERLDPPVRHVRAVVWWAGRGVVILDRLTPLGPHRVRTTLNFAPGTGVRALEGVEVCGLGSLGEPNRHPTTFWPHLGTSRASHGLEMSGYPGAKVFGWSILRLGRRVGTVDSSGVTLVEGQEETRVPLSWHYGPLRA